MTLKDIGYSGITVIFAIALVMFVYTALNDVITVTLYGLAISNGVDPGLANNIVLFWDFFPVPFLFSLVIWMIYTATRGGTDTW